MSSQPMELDAPFAASSSAASAITPLSTTIRLTVRNQSTHICKSGGEWSVKDETPTPPVIATARFNRIPPGASDTQTVNLPTGFEWGAFRFLHESGAGEWTSIHGGNNTTEVRLNLLD